MTADNGAWHLRLRLALASFWLPIALFAIFSGALLGIGISLFLFEQRSIEKSAEEDLLVIARNKSAAVSNWIFERRGDAQALADELALTRDLEQWLADGAPADSRRLRVLRRLKSTGVYRNYADAALVDLLGRVVAGTGDPTLIDGPQFADIERQAATSRQAQFGTAHGASENAGAVVMDVAAPVVGPDDGRTVGVVVLTIDPRLQLYPMIEQWPGKSDSAETNIVVAGKDSVAFVTAPRHRNAAARTLSLPLSAATPYAAAAQGGEGTAEGLDYQGIPVLTASAAISGTPWHLVAQIDSAEVSAPFRAEAAVSAVSVCVLVAATGILLLAAWTRQQATLITRQYQAEMARRGLEQQVEDRSRAVDEARAQLAAVVESSRSGIIAVNLDGIVTAWNEGATRIYGYSAEEMIGRPIATVASPEPRVEVRERLEGVALALEPTSQEVVRIRKDGQPIHVLQAFSPINGPEGELVGASAIILDITERKQAERILQKTARALRTLSRGNEALVRAASEEELFQEMCRVIVEVGEYRMAWVGIAGHDSAKTVCVAAAAGNVDGYFEQVRVTWDETVPGQGPTGMAIKTGSVQINQDFENNPAVAPWWPEARRRGYRASIALPIRRAGEAIGALVIYAGEADAFGPEETRLLTELANDLSFGLVALESHAREQLLSRAIDCISDAISIYDAEDRLVWTNRRYNELFSLSRTEVYGKTFEQVIRIAIAKGQYPAANGRADEYVRQRLAAHRQPGLPILNYMNVGSGLWIQGRDDHMPDGHIVAVRANVTSLVEAEERFRSLADNLPGIVFRWIVAPNREIRDVYVSAGVERMLVVKPEEFIAGKARLTDFLHPDDRERNAARIRESMDKQTPLAMPGERFIGRNRSIRWWQINATPHRLLDGSMQYDGIALDITEQRQVEDQLRRVQRLESLGHLTSGISHDFNNLLGAIIGSLDLAMDRAAGDPDLRELIQTATDTALHGSELIKRLLTFSRGQVLSPRIVDLNGRLAGLKRLLQQALGTNIKIDLRLDEALWHCLIDPAQIDDVVLNLALNAKDAMPDGGRLAIETANVHMDTGALHGIERIEPGDYVRLSVADSGKGMSREVLDRVFEPFFTTKGPDKGTGLGLSQVYGFVKQSNGHVIIDSEVDMGTTVTIYLPRAGESVGDSPSVGDQD